MCCYWERGLLQAVSPGDFLERLASLCGTVLRSSFWPEAWKTANIIFIPNPYKQRQRPLAVEGIISAKSLGLEGRDRTFDTPVDFLRPPEGVVQRAGSFRSADS